MAKLIKYDNSGVEESGGGTGVKVKPGVHVAEIKICRQRDTNKSGNPANDIEVALNVGSAYDWVFTYIGLNEASDWKLAEFTRALGLKEKGQFDPEKQVGKLIRVKINADQYEGQYAPRAGKMFKVQPGDEVSDTGVSESSTNGDAPDDDVPEDDAEESDAGFEPSREGDELGSYDDWSDEDILAEAEDRGLTLPGGRGPKRDKAIKALREDDNAASDAADEPEAEAAGDDDDYDSWDIDQLKQEWNDREMGDLPPIKGRNAEGRMKTAIIEQLRADDEENPFEA